MSQIVYLEPGDEVQWNGKDFLYFYEGRFGFTVQDITGDHPYIELPDPKEEDYYAGGELKGDMAREDGE